MNQDVLNSKKEVVSQIDTLVKESGALVVCEYRGLSVAKISELRRALREKGAHMTVYNNSLVSRALKENHENIDDILTKFAKQNDALQIKGGVIDGKYSDKDYVIKIANLPSKEGLVSMLLSVLQAPMRNLAYSLSQVSEKK